VYRYKLDAGCTVNYSHVFIFYVKEEVDVQYVPGDCLPKYRWSWPYSTVPGDYLPRFVRSWLHRTIPGDYLPIYKRSWLYRTILGDFLTMYSTRGVVSTIRFHVITMYKRSWLYSVQYCPRWVPTYVQEELAVQCTVRSRVSSYLCRRGGGCTVYSIWSQVSSYLCTSGVGCTVYSKVPGEFLPMYKWSWLGSVQYGSRWVPTYVQVVLAVKYGQLFPGRYPGHLLSSSHRPCKNNWCTVE
jgi:hypothetical protein